MSDELPIDMRATPEIEAFLDAPTNTISYLVADPASGAGAVIDSVMGFDYASGRLTSEQGDLLVARIRERGLSLEWLIETHVHADHLSAAPMATRR